jgi:anaerobic magnesium-protoporphyrin IX monomethyl ester cyclase
MTETRINANNGIKIDFMVPPSSYLGDPMRNPPLGILYIAAVAEKEGYGVKITDLRGKPPESFPQLIGKSDIYAITATTPDYPAAKEMAKIAKSKNKKAWIVIGGVHATSVPEKIDPVFDKVVIGEGEISVLRVLDDYKKGDNGTRFYQGEMVKDLDSLPFPARHLLPFDSVFSPHALFYGAGPTATIITSRGCPYDCSFCASKTMWHRRVRFRSPKNIIEEIKHVIDTYGVKNFRFHDDTMTVKKDWLKEICNGIKPFGIKWRAGTRVDNVTYEIMKMMKEAGCDEIAFGIESLDQGVLDRANKRIRLPDVYKAVKVAKEAGMCVRLFFIIGLPGEKPGYADRLIRFCEEANPDAVDVSTLVPFPGCDIYKDPKNFGFDMDTGDFEEYVMTRGLGKEEIDTDFIFKHDVMSNEELKAERKKILEYIKSRKMVKNF